MVAFMRNNIAEDERITSNGGLEMSLFLADVDADGNWQNIHPFAHNSGSTGFPCFSADGKTLYYASNRSGGFGGFDIYKSEKRGAFWSEPINLGSKINSQGDEITPFHDGNALYFASDWHFGFGGYDIFKVAGSEIVNLGTGVNSSGDDFGFVYTPSVSTGFFVSNRKGVRGKDDIYRVKTNAGESANVVILDNGNPLKDAQVKVIEGSATNLSMLKGGNYLVNLSDRKSVTLEVKKEGFATKTLKIDPKYDNSSRIYEIEMQRAVPTQMSTIPEYTTIITDGSSGEPLEGVLVTLVNQQTNTLSDLHTDARGKIKFPMTVNGVYTLIMSKEGFVVSEKVVKANEAKSRYLGEMTLKPSAVTNKIDNSPSVKEVKKPNDYSIKVVPSSTMKPQDEPKLTDTPVKTEPTTPLYSVQFAVLRLTDVLNLDKYANLKSEGNIYAVPDNDVKKVRLGIFKTRAEVVTAVKKAASLGYADAFIVEEKNEPAIAENMYTPTAAKPALVDQPVYVPVPPKQTKDIPQPYNTTVKPPKLPKEMPQPYSVALPPKKPATPSPLVELDSVFKVRIASFKKPELFDDSKVSKLWKIEKIKEGDLTIFIMDGFKTLEDANAMRKKVQTAGYKDARVVLKTPKGFTFID